MFRRFLLVFIISQFTLNAFGQGTWSQKAYLSLKSDSRAGAASFRIGSNIYFGLGVNTWGIYFDDFWKYDTLKDKWTEIAKFPGTARAHSIAFVADGKAYVGLGYSYLVNGTGSTLYNDFYEYDPTHNRWTPKADFPGESRVHGCSFVLNDTAYIAGGQGLLNKTFKDIYYYIPYTNQWGFKDSSNNRLFGDTKSFVLNNKVYIINSNGQYLTEYHPGTNTYIDRANLPQKITYGARSVSMGSQGYLLFGHVPGTPYMTKNVYRYNSLIDSWSTESTTLNSISGKEVGAAETLGSRILYISGYSIIVGSSASSPEVIRFDTAQKAWTFLNEFGHGSRAYASAAGLGKNGYVGFGYSYNLDKHRSCWKYISPLDSWVRVPNPSATGRMGAACFALNGKYYVMGGLDSSFNLNISGEFWELDTATEIWTKRANLPIDNETGLGLTDGKYGYLLGGINPGLVYSRKFFRYDPVSDSWGSMQDLPVGGTQFMGGCFLDGSFYVAGGVDSVSYPKKYFYRFDTASRSWAALPYLPEARKLPHVMEDGRFVYIIGGLDSFNNVIRTVLRYDPLTNTLSTIDPLPGLVTLGPGTSTFKANNKFYFMGGQVAIGQNYKIGLSSALYEYDPSWLRIDSFPTIVCAGNAARVKFTSTNLFSSTNIFQIELSDSSGSFSSPTLQTYVPGGNKGLYSANITFPITLTGGTNYKIRVTGSHPAYISEPRGPITIIPGTNPDFTINDSIQDVQSNSYNFSVIDHSYDSVWYVVANKDTIRGKSVHYQFDTSGVFNVRLFVKSNNGCIRQKSKNVLILPSPIAFANVNDSIQCFDNNQFILINKSSNYNSIGWYLNDSLISTKDTLKLSFFIPIHQNIKLIAKSRVSAYDTFDIKLYIYNAPSASFLINDSIQCLNENLFLFTNTSDTSEQRKPYTFHWYLKNLKVSTTIDYSHRFNSIGTDSVRLQISDSLGCISSYSSIVKINPSPIASFKFLSDSIQCHISNQFSIQNKTILTYGSLSYEWLLDNYVDTVTHLNFITPDTGTKALILVSKSDMGCADTAFTTYRTYKVQAKQIIGDNPVLSNITKLYRVTSTKGSSFKWLVSNGSLLSANGLDSILISWDSLRSLDSGLIKVVETDSNGCMGDTMLIYVNIQHLINLHNVEARKPLVYPIPANDLLSIKFPEDELGYISIIDVLGREFIRNDFNGNTVYINVNSLTPGNYILHWVGIYGAGRILFVKE